MSNKKKNRNKKTKSSNYGRSVKFSAAKTAGEPKIKTEVPLITLEKPKVKIKHDKKKYYTVKKEQKKKERKNAELIALNAKKEKARKTKIALLVSAAVLVLMVAFVFVTVLSLTSPYETEVGEKLSLTQLDRGIGALLCTYHDDPARTDTSTVGEKTVNCTFLGFIDKPLKVRVKDTVSPVIELRNVVSSEGVNVKPEDFVSLSSDKTAVTYSFTEEIKTEELKPGEYDIGGSAVDEGGNVTTKEARLTVDEKREKVSIEYGTSKEETLEAIYAEYTDIYRDSISYIPTECGEYNIRGTAGSGYRIVPCTVSDTLPPLCEIKSFDIPLGLELTADDIFESTADASNVTYSLENVPDFSVPGKYEITAIAEDEWGNRSEYVSTVYIHKLNLDITVEAGCDVSLIEEEIFGDGEREGLSLEDGFSSSGNVPGEYTYNLVGEYGTVPVKINIVDTKAPVLVLRDSVAFIGQEITPDILVYSCDDGTPVTYEFKSQPHNDKAHTEEVTVIATDSAGNKTEESAFLYICDDTEPPVIYGMSTVYLNVGENGDYKSGVYAVDNSDGKMEVTTDSSGVDTSIPGTYYVSYSATDKAGNTSYASSLVIVSEITYETVNQIVVEVLPQIINDNMTDREKAYEIFLWVKDYMKYSSRTGYLIGRFYEAAYTGFRNRAGNCYVYYSVTASLLTAAGIENIEIRRNSESNPHYWNLVKIDGSWYHLDTCPHYAQYPITSFLLTDAEMRDYSENQSIGYYDFDSSLYPATP